MRFHILFSIDIFGNVRIVLKVTNYNAFNLTIFHDASVKEMIYNTFLHISVLLHRTTIAL